ncbi:hypothetical protein AB0Y14_08480 [Rothia sp. HC945]|uniref:hypothetical protein n=1 Tax=Rothia sp. HC945 TaxID=3171170 RepID=UPI003F24B05F
MDNKTKTAGLLLGGYLLGRAKKLKLALVVASTVSGTTAFSKRKQLSGALSQFAQSTPELKELGEKITGRLADSGKGAAMNLATRGADQLGAKLQERTDSLKASLDDPAKSLQPEVAAEESDSGTAAEDKPRDVTEDAAPEEEVPAAETVENEPDAAEAPEEEEPKHPTQKRSSSSQGTAKSGSAPARGTSKRGAPKKSSTSKSQHTTKRANTTRKNASSSRKGDSA